MTRALLTQIAIGVVVALIVERILRSRKAAQATGNGGSAASLVSVLTAPPVRPTSGPSMGKGVPK